MSLCVYGQIERKVLNENSVETCLYHYFSDGYEIIKENSDCTVYEIKNNESKTIVSFINEKKFPYNVYDSDIVNGEFEYHQLLLFAPCKEDATVHFYAGIMGFLECLSQEMKTRILVTSDAHDEICLFDAKNIVWAKNNASIKEIMTFFNSQDRAR